MLRSAVVYVCALHPEYKLVWCEKSFKKTYENYQSALPKIPKCKTYSETDNSKNGFQ